MNSAPGPLSGDGNAFIDKCNEYKVAIVLVFIDFKEAIDSVGAWSILEIIEECRVGSRYLNTIRYVYKRTAKFKIGRGESETG